MTDEPTPADDTAARVADQLRQLFARHLAAVMEHGMDAQIERLTDIAERFERKDTEMSDDNNTPQGWAEDFRLDAMWRQPRNENTKLDAGMSDEPQEIQDGDTVTVYRPGQPFMLTVSQSLPEYVFEETSREHLPDGTLRIRFIRRERRPDDVPNAVLSRPDTDNPTDLG